MGDVTTVRVRFILCRRLMAPTHVIYHRQPSLYLNFWFEKYSNVVSFTPLS